MSYIQVENLSKSFSDRLILNKISLSINEGDKVALVAQNGTGKSTLLKILMGKEIFDDGKITMQKGVKVAFLSQEPDMNEDKTIMEELFTSTSPTIAAVKLYEESLEDLYNQEKMQKAYEAMSETNAWEYELKIKEILEKLDLHNLHDTIATFSGGQKKRLALAKILIDTPDFLIMDEPTNHLDLDMIDWLEEYLSERPITLLLVTHDRYFLERVCNEIIELDKGNIYKYKGNYSYYLEKKDSREINENTNIDKTKLLLKKELEWVRKQPRGRQAKATARVDAYYDLKSSVKEKNTVEKVKLDIVGKNLGGKILEIHNLTKSFGKKKILDKFTYSFNKGEKIGIIGKNGVGKTTFLNIIMGTENADGGKIVKGESVQFGYYSQSGLDLKDNEKIIDSVKKIALFTKLSDGTEISASKMLERFLFPPLLQQNTISKLSGGEKRRLYLLEILMANPNFLILDEPTNDFDLMTLNIVEEFLQSFKGCLIIISHDRYFMDKIVDHLFIFEGEAKIRDFPGNYSQYRSIKEEEIEKSIDKTTTISNKNSINKLEKKSKANLDASNLYKEIKTLERKKEGLSTKLDNTELSYEEIIKISEEIKKLLLQIEEKSEKWLAFSN